MYAETLTQRLAFANGIVPQTLNNAYANTNGVDMSLCHRALFVLYLGSVTGGGNIKASLQESADNSTWQANGSAGSFSGSGGNNVQEAALTTANKITTFEVRADQLSAGKRYVRLNVGETGSQNVLVACVAFSDEGNHKPNNANNGTQVGTQDVVN